ncbi:MAG: cupin domain-containing protein [Caldimonas sp.]
MIAQSFMDIASPEPLLGGLSPRDFMRRHWHKKPLLIRAAVPYTGRIVTRSALFDLAAREGIESRLVTRSLPAEDRWSLRQGPFARRALPSLKTPRWTLLVQGTDLHLASAHRLLERFRFVPDARLDDVMFSFATDGGGVGPHIDSYDVFLLQVHGSRRWRIGRLRKPVLRSDVPLKLLANFSASQEWLLGPGDMLYLPPGWAHDGVAEGETITASIGFRSAGRQTLASDVLQRLLDDLEDDPDERRYADPDQDATTEPARIPVALQRFAADAVARLVGDAAAHEMALGEALSEPKPGVWFDPVDARSAAGAVRLDRRSRMLYDDRHLYLNGEAFRASGRDAKIVRRLADARSLEASDVSALSAGARSLVEGWLGAGWLRSDVDEEHDDGDTDPPGA